NLADMKKVDARRERSDFVAVPACAVIAESMMAWSLAKYFIQKFGGDSLEEMRDNYNSYNMKLFSRIKNNFKR
ncbi:MAG: chorismate synthase, partial [Ignavibacterium sp.]|nr:chorismate synthase [Ignavibacterium sp.]